MALGDLAEFFALRGRELIGGPIAANRLIRPAERAGGMKRAQPAGAGRTASCAAQCSVAGTSPAKAARLHSSKSTRLFAELLPTSAPARSSS